MPAKGTGCHDEERADEFIDALDIRRIAQAAAATPLPDIPIRRTFLGLADGNTQLR
ncbi:hypothetical protein GCM10011610_71170 [Nocardia rhizosphaerihabitans]|uniref:Uncharacterized protein n=1 Tax=Nocardia rhizosphaerihabitans TaxID=1691570 RepID=A0ABQ2L3Z4_9NOCA|nr:hypothetical protein GCM10011610_71170 [Nocardia rhizosphaerihabitans]